MTSPLFMRMACHQSHNCSITSKSTTAAFRYMSIYFTSHFLKLAKEQTVFSLQRLVKLFNTSIIISCLPSVSTNLRILLSLSQNIKISPFAANSFNISIYFMNAMSNILTTLVIVGFNSAYLKSILFPI